MPFELTEDQLQIVEGINATSSAERCSDRRGGRMAQPRRAIEGSVA
jgi:hypothetical protein